MVTLKAGANVEIQFNGRHALFVRVGPEYREQLCGMCGNFNGDRRDDLILPNGERASNNAEFGNAWTSDISPPRCVRYLLIFPSLSVNACLHGHVRSSPYTLLL